MLAVTYVSDII